MTLTQVKNGLKDPKRILLHMLDADFFRGMNDARYLKLKYWASTGKRLHLEQPVSYNEKLQWLKLHDRKPVYTEYADKYAVRAHIARLIGEEYLIPLLGVWDTAEQVDFDALPNAFVLKPTHTSGNVLVCRDKTALNVEQARRTMKEWLAREYFWYHREWPYQNIRPRIICEQLLENQDGSLPEDYKLMCFGGKPKCVFVCADRDAADGLKIDIYNEKWKRMDFRRATHPASGRDLPMPENFPLMRDLAEKLSEGFAFIRVDFYDVGGKVYFGELTFYPAAGFEAFDPPEYDEILGGWIDLPSV